MHPDTHRHTQRHQKKIVLMGSGSFRRAGMEQRAGHPLGAEHRPEGLRQHPAGERRPRRSGRPRRQLWLQQPGAAPPDPQPEHSGRLIITHHKICLKNIFYPVSRSETFFLNIFYFIFFSGTSDSGARVQQSAGTGHRQTIGWGELPSYVYLTNQSDWSFNGAIHVFIYLTICILFWFLVICKIKNFKKSQIITSAWQEVMQHFQCVMWHVCHFASATTRTSGVHRGGDSFHLGTFTGSAWCPAQPRRSRPAFASPPRLATREGCPPRVSWSPLHTSILDSPQRGRSRYPLAVLCDHVSCFLWRLLCSPLWGAGWQFRRHVFGLVSRSALPSHKGPRPGLVGPPTNHCPVPYSPLDFCALFTLFWLQMVVSSFC